MNTLETLQYMQLKFRNAEPGFDPASDSAIARSAKRILEDKTPQAECARFWAEETLNYAMGHKFSTSDLVACLGTLSEAVQQYENPTT